MIVQVCRGTSRWVVAVSIVLSGWCSAAGAEPRAFTIATGEWIPYVSACPFPGHTVPRAGAYGAASEVVVQVLTEMGLDPVVAFKPWSEVLPAVEKGQVDAAFPYAWSQERGEQLLYSDPLFDTRAVVFYNRGRIPVPDELDDWSDLAGRQLGLVRSGYHYDPRITSSAAEIQWFPDEVSAFAALVTGEIALFPADKAVGQQLLGMLTEMPDTCAGPLEGGCQHRLADLCRQIRRGTGTGEHKGFDNSRLEVGILPGLEYPNPVHLVIGRDGTDSGHGRKQFRADFNQALTRFKQTGGLRAILDSYRISAPERDAGLDSPNEVVLIARGAFPLIVGAQDKPEARSGEQSRRFLIPPGTRAVVNHWHSSFREPSDLNVQEQMYEESQVRVLDGPLRGRLLWVPNIFISFE